MPRIARPLTHTEVSKARTPDKALSLHDGDGLFLLIKPSGKNYGGFAIYALIPRNAQHSPLAATWPYHWPTQDSYGQNI